MTSPVAFESINEADVLEWQPYCIHHLTEILNGNYELEKAREDILSFRKISNSAE